MTVGVASHAVGYGEGAHPTMYWVVWDMFCGWTAYSTRTHILAEGVSGQWYDAGRGDWPKFHPYGHLERVDYDLRGVHAPRIGLNVLRHTEHEPIARLVVVEECFPKKFNLPEPHWSARWGAGVKKDPTSYYAVRHVLTPRGRLLGTAPGWINVETNRTLLDNPKVRRLSSRPALVAGASPP